MTPYINELAIKKGEWPTDYHVFELVVVDGDKIRMTGDRPIGFRIDNGSPIFPRGSERAPRSVTVTFDEYKAAIQKTKESQR